MTKQTDSTDCKICQEDPRLCSSLHKDQMSSEPTESASRASKYLPNHKNHKWRGYAQLEGTVVCDECNIAEEVNSLIEQTNIGARISVLIWVIRHIHLVGNEKAVNDFRKELNHLIKQESK